MLNHILTSFILQGLPAFSLMPRRSARLAAKRKRDTRFADDDAKEESPDAVDVKEPPKKKRKTKHKDLMSDEDDFPTQWNTSDDAEDEPQSPMLYHEESPSSSDSETDKKKKTKIRKRKTRKSGKTSGSKRKRKKKVNTDDEVYEPEKEIVSESEKDIISDDDIIDIEPPKRKRRRRNTKKKEKIMEEIVECQGKDKVKGESMDIDVGEEDKKSKEKEDMERDGDSSDDSDAEDQGLDGIFGGTEVVEPMEEDPTPKRKVKPKRKKSVKKRKKKEEEYNSDISVHAKPKRKSIKRRKKPKGEYTQEQIEMVFRKLDEEGNGRLSMLNILHGFHTINQSDKIEAGLAKRMLLYADKQHDNDSVVRLNDFLAMTRLADLWPVA